MLLRRGDLPGGRNRIDQVRQCAAPLSLRLLARDVRAELATAQGRRTAALTQIRHGLEDLHAWQSSFGSLDLQTMVVGHGVGWPGAVWASLWSRGARVIYEWSERARMLASRIQPVRVPLDEQMTADLAELRS